LVLTTADISRPRWPRRSLPVVAAAAAGVVFQ